jgi:hypothetical protein
VYCFSELFVAENQSAYLNRNPADADRADDVHVLFVPEIDLHSVISRSSLSIARRSDFRIPLAIDRDRRIAVPASVETVCKNCFSECFFLGAVAFDSGSHLTLIGESAFIRCSLLKSICSDASRRSELFPV